MSEVIGTAGSDLLDTGLSGVSQIYGGLGDDVYKISWAAQPNVSRDLFITEIGGKDTLDLSNIVENPSDDVWFIREQDRLQIRIYVQNKHDATIYVEDHFKDSSAALETIQFKDSAFDLPALVDVPTLNGLLNGATDKADKIDVVTIAQVAGFAGNDSLTGSTLYGNEGDDTLVGEDSGYNHLYGGEGNDRLVMGQSSDAKLFGGQGNDTYIIADPRSSSENIPTLNLTESLDPNISGVDTIDLSAVANSIDDIEIFDETIDGQGVIRVAGADGKAVLLIHYTGDFEKLLIDGEHHDFASQSAKAEAASKTFGATETADDLNLSTYDGRWFSSGGGDDTVAASLETNVLDTGAGDDVITTGQAGEYHALTLIGGDGNDTYKITWQDLGGPTGSVPLMDIFEYGHEGAGTADTIDLSGVASSFADISFSTRFGAIEVEIRDPDNITLGYFMIKGASDEAFPNHVERIVIGDQLLNLADAKSVQDLEMRRLELAVERHQQLEGGDFEDNLNGGEGDDTIQGHDGDDVIHGGDDNDKVFGGAGDDYLYGNDGGDVLIGGAGADSIVGGNGNDRIWAGADDNSADHLIGGWESYQVAVDVGHDIIGAGAGDDTIEAGYGDDTVYGANGQDHIDGYDGNDLLFNGDGNDVVLAGKGDDTLWGGSGDDQLTGGEGRDVFAFAPGNGQDTVTDFSTQDDKLNLSGFGISDLSAIAEAKTQGGKQGVLLTLDDATSAFLEGVSISDISNNLLTTEA